jgi:iron(III) transport system ATP-binding protein
MLQLSDLAIRLGDRTVVENLSLDLQVREIGCLLGASGCGKTTVLRAIAGFERPAAGSIVLAGKEVSSAAKMLPPEQRQIGMVFQDYALFPHLTVAGNIAFGLRGAGRAEQATRVADALKLVGLDHVEQRYPHELSGGQQQRVALARALAPRPQLLLMDEPFSNLDVELRERLGQEVRAILKAAGMTAILVTHDQREAFAVADKVGVMTDGHIRQWATPYDLYHQPLDRFVADFVGEGVLLPGIVAAGGKVEFELGIVHGKMPENCCMGCVADVLVRPDDVLHDDASSMKARVLAKAFRGAQFLYTLALPSGQKVLSLVPSHHNHALGEDIGIRLEIDHVIAFKRG